MQNTIPISLIRTNGGTQPRAAMDFEAVDDYMDAMQAGAHFPPLDVFYDGAAYWLADGFHRLRASEQAGKAEVAVNIHQGTQEDAQWFSFSANKANGLRRTNEDKQRAIKAALAHPKSRGMSDSAISKHIGVGHSSVSEWRKKVCPLSETESASDVSNTTKRICSDGRTMNTGNIGRRREVSVLDDPAPPVDAYVSDVQYAEPVVEPEEEIAPRVIEPPATRPEPIRVHAAPPKPEPRLDREKEAAGLTRSIFELAEHGISAGEVVALTSSETIGLLYQKARAAFEFTGFICEASAKRQKDVA